MIQNPNSDLLSVVIPIYNEAENIPELISETEAALKDFQYEIILVDDGSTDATVKEIKKINNPEVTLIELKKNYGQSLALAAGIDYAKGNYIITMDGDLQNSPHDIPKMYEKAKSDDLDLVVGYRKNRQDSFFKTIPSKIANRIIRNTTKLNIKDHGCALKIFERETAKDLNLYGEMHRYISLLAHLNGAKITEMEVSHHPRTKGKSKYGLGRTTKVINDLVLLLFLRKYIQKPIYFFGNIGMFSGLIGALILGYLLFIKFGTGQDIGNRPLLILGVLLLFIGIQFFTTGILIDLQMRTYFESQQMRPYKIRKIYTGETKSEKKSVYNS